MSVNWFTWRSTAMALICYCALFAAQANGQSTASMETDPGLTISLTVGFDGVSTMGPISGVDTDQTDVSGAALVTLFPTDPPFTHCKVHSLSMAIGQVQFTYWLFVVIRVDMTFGDLVIESTEPLYGVIDSADLVTFAVAPLRVTGTAHIVSQGLGIDEMIPVDAESTETVRARLSETGGTVVLDGIVVPLLEAAVPQDQLPVGILSLTVSVDTDADGVVYRGAYEESLIGDGDADGDFDLLDYAGLHECLLGPGGPAGVYCSLFMHDLDDDVDLADVAVFQTLIGGP